MALSSVYVSPELRDTVVTPPTGCLNPLPPFDKFVVGGSEFKRLLANLLLITAAVQSYVNNPNYEWGGLSSGVDLATLSLNLATFQTVLVKLN